MHMQINKTRHHVASFCVDHLVCLCRYPFFNLYDLIVFYQHIVYTVPVRHRIQHMSILY